MHRASGGRQGFLVQGNGGAEYGQELHQLLEVHQARIRLDLRDPGLAHSEKRPHLGLREAACMPQRPQVLAQLTREADGEATGHAASL